MSEQQGTEATMTARLGFISICMLLIFAPLTRGAVHLWAHTIIQLGAVVCGLGMLISKGAIFSKPVMDSPITRPLVSLALLSGITAAISPYQSLAWEGCLMFFTYVLLYFSAQVFIRSRKQQRIIIWVITCNTLFICTLAYLTSGERVLPMWIFDGITNEGGFLTGTYRNHNHFAGLLEMSILLFLGFWLPRGHAIEKNILAGGLVVVLLSTLALTNSRGGWISMGAGLCVLSGCLLKHNKFHSRSLKWVILFTLVAGFFSLASPTVNERLATFLLDSQLGDFRLRVWESCLDMIKGAPITGTGPGTFSQAFVRHSPPGVPSLPVYAHNEYLQFTSETGLFFPILFIWLAYEFYKNALSRLNSSSRQTRGIALGAMASVFAILVHSLFDFNLHIPGNALTFAVIAALAAAPPGERRKKTRRLRRSEG